MASLATAAMYSLQITSISQSQLQHPTNFTLSTMDHITNISLNVNNTNSINKNAAAMINLLIFICAHCTAQDHTPIFQSLNNLIMATFDYVTMINYNKNECGCYSSNCRD